MDSDNQFADIVAKIKSWLEKAAPNRTLVIVLLVLVYPLGAYLMWKGNHFSKNVRWIITGVLIVWTLMLFSPSENEATYEATGGSCSASFERNGCTYYRDSNCNVIAQSCS